MKRSLPVFSRRACPPRLFLASAIFIAWPTTLRAADPVADIEAQYQQVLAILKRPSTTGILVTEVLPESAAAAGTEGGIHAGDIITSYYGTRVADLATLRAQVAEAIAHRVADEATNRVVVRLRRGIDDVVLQVPREALGIRCLEVQAGVAGPRNPPPNLRGTLKLDWAPFLDSLRHTNADAILRTVEREFPPPATQPGPSIGPAAAPVPNETWVGWQTWEFRPDAGGAGPTERFGISATLRIFSIDPTVENPTPVVSTFTFHLWMGDYSTTPAFLLDTASVHYPVSSGREVIASATRVGEMLRTEMATAQADTGRTAPVGEHHNVPVSLDAIIQAAIPIIAAGMPHEADNVLPVHLVSVRDFLPRPGYVLATRGEMPMPAAPTGSVLHPKPGVADLAWRVDLMHCGVVIESYWFSDMRRLLCIESGGGGGGVGGSTVSRRVARLDEASSADIPASQPAASRSALPVTSTQP
jgi:hypothetical protein